MPDIFGWLMSWIAPPACMGAVIAFRRRRGEDPQLAPEMFMLFFGYGAWWSFLFFWQIGPYAMLAFALLPGAFAVACMRDSQIARAANIEVGFIVGFAAPLVVELAVAAVKCAAAWVFHFLPAFHPYGSP